MLWVVVRIPLSHGHVEIAAEKSTESILGVEAPFDVNRILWFSIERESQGRIIWERPTLVKENNTMGSSLTKGRLAIGKDQCLISGGTTDKALGNKEPF